MAFFAAGEPMSGGTGHVVEAALAKMVPVHAWTIDESGTIDRIGEYSPDGPH
jgi:hypothetical protein